MCNIVTNHTNICAEYHTHPMLLIQPNPVITTSVYATHRL